MKRYVKPIFEFVELRIEERLAACDPLVTEKFKVGVGKCVANPTAS
jgi:hypothetical protein